MEVDFKITTWERIVVPDEYKEIVVEKIKSGEIENGNQLYEFIMQEEETDKNLEAFTLKETEDYLSLEQNLGYSTIDVRIGEETIYENGN